MAEEALKRSQKTTMGAKPLANLLIPNGWEMKRRMRIAQLIPTMADLVRSGL